MGPPLATSARSRDRLPICGRSKSGLPSKKASNCFVASRWRSSVIRSTGTNSAADCVTIAAGVAGVTVRYPAHALRDGGLTMTAGLHRNRLHYALVVGETSLGFALLIGSSLLIKSMLNLAHLDPGFDTEGTLHFDVALSQARYPDPTKVPFYNGSCLLSLPMQPLEFSGLQRRPGRGIAHRFRRD